MTVTQTGPPEEAPPARLDKGKTSEIKQFISCTIGDEGYAIDIMAVREIKGSWPVSYYRERL